MSALIFIAFWGAIAYFVFYRRFIRRSKRTTTPGQKFELTPATAAGIAGVISVIPGLWILRVEGWTDSWSMNLNTGQTTESSTFGSQLGKAAVYFVIGAALLYAAKVMAERQTRWPLSIQQQIDRLGLAHGAAQPSPTPHGFVGNESQHGSQFHSPPGWPVPPQGWTPPNGWTPDPAWPPAPPGWQFWSYGGANTD
jgi:hypothetical protein